MDNLILQIQQDNEHAFKRLYQAYYIRVATFIMGIIKKHDIAEDLAQDVFVNLWINRKTLDATRSLQNYIFVSSLNYLKKEMVFSSEPLEAQADVSTGNMVEDTFFAKEIALLIEMVVSEMPEQRQRIYRMNREQGLSNEEIADRLGISKRSVENQVSLALKEIREAIAAYLIFWLCMLS